MTSRSVKFHPIVMMFPGAILKYDVAVWGGWVMVRLPAGADWGTLNELDDWELEFEPDEGAVELPDDADGPDAVDAPEDAPEPEDDGGGVLAAGGAAMVNRNNHAEQGWSRRRASEWTSSTATAMARRPARNSRNFETAQGRPHVFCDA